MYTLNVSDGTAFHTILGQVDQLLTIVTNNNNPQGNYAAGSVGVWAFRPDTSSLFICTSTDHSGDPAGTVWTSVVFSLGTATTSVPGAVQLATDGEAVTGTNSTKALTPHAAAAAFVTQTAYNAEVAVLQGEIDTLAAATGTANATANTVMARDSNANSSIATPTANGHIANKLYVDNQIAAIVATESTSAGANTVALRNGSGQLTVATPSSGGHAATKDYVDTGSSVSTTVAAATDAPTPSVIMKRDSSGFAQVNASSDSSTTSKIIATLGQLNTLAGTVSVNGTTLATAVSTLAAATSAATPSVLAKRDGSGNLSVGTPTASDHATTKSYVDTAVGRPNLIINGGFTFFRRQVPGTATSRSTGTYGPDRWFMLTSSLATDCQSKRIDDTATGGNHKYACQVINNSGSAKIIGIAQAIPSDDAIPLRGQTVTFAFLAKAGSGTPNLRAAIIEFTGTPDSINFGGTVGRDPVNSYSNTTYTTGNFFKTTSLTVAAVSSSLAQTTSYQQFSVTATISTSASNLILMVWEESTVASGASFTITQAQLSIGSGVRPWYPQTFALDKLACNRFYHSTYPEGVAPGTANAAGSYVAPWLFASFTSSQSQTFYATNLYPQMRAIPTITMYSGVTGTINRVYVQIAGADRTTATPGNIGDSGFSSVVLPSPGGVNVQEGDLFLYHFTADAEL